MYIPHPCLDRPLTHKKLIEYELEGFGIRLNKVRVGIPLVTVLFLNCMLLC